jgi:hypothetical protein
MYIFNTNFTDTEGLGPHCWEELGIPNEKMYIDAYCRRSRLVKKISNWNFYMVLSRLLTYSLSFLLSLSLTYVSFSSYSDM